MSEHYAFLAMSVIQILVGSVLGPTWLIRRVRVRLASISAERFEAQFPGVDRNVSAHRFATRYRAQNTAIALIGLLLLVLLSIPVRHPGWTDQRIMLATTGYLLLQVSPLMLLGWKAGQHNKALRYSLAQVKRKAVLQRRSLFDFIAPGMVLLAVLSYLFFVALVLYIRQHPFPGFGGLTNVYIITAVWAFYALIVYGNLYGRKPNPLVTHEDRLHSMEIVVRTCIYTLFAVTSFASFQLMLSMLQLRQWTMPANSAFFVLCLFLAYWGVRPWQRPNGTVLGSGGPLPPAASDPAV